MIEHVSIPVSDLSGAKALYGAALRPLGYELVQEYDEAAGYKEGGHTSFWLVEKPKSEAMHVALRAPRKEAVEEFHRAALAAGGKNNGAPGYRTDYSPGYYAAFFLDADGNNVEAVWFDPQKEKES